jgi:hypothetical protein
LISEQYSELSPSKHDPQRKKNKKVYEAQRKTLGAAYAEYEVELLHHP